MNRYKPSTPRLVLGALAVATAAVNFAVLVVLPAGLDGADADAQLASTSQALPHTDSGRATLATADTRDRRHELFARVVANLQDAGVMRLAGPLTTTRSDR